MTGLHKLRRRAAGLAAVVAVGLAVGGCSTSTASNTQGPRWLVRVNGDYANVFAIQAGNRPSPKAHAVELGRQFTTKELDAAAAKLGVPPGNVTLVAASK